MHLITSSLLSHQVITLNLVTVHDIEELQSQNQQLRASLRILSEKNEAEEKEETERIKGELRAALVELEEMRQNRGKQAELVEAIVKQVCREGTSMV